MRSYVVKRFSHFRHSRRRRMESASLLSRESTTLSFANPQKGHFMGLGNSSHCNRERKSLDAGKWLSDWNMQGFVRRSSGGRRWRRRYADLLLLAALCGKSPERKSLAMSQQQAKGNYGNERDQPQHDSATGS